MKLKKNKLVLISIILVFIIIMVSCDDNNEKPIIDSPTPSNEVVAHTLPSATPPLLLEDLAKYGVVLNKLLIREENYTQYPYIEEWESMIKENYNIDIKINFESIGFQYFTDYYLQNRDNLTNMTGIVYISELRGNGDIQKLIDKEAIIPLTDILANNNVFNKSPIEYQNLFKFGDGEIWAIPGEIRYNSYNVRITKSNWLENIGLEAPTSYSSLLEVARRFKTKDPDQDGKDNTYGLNTPNDNTFMGLEDLFAANGVYLDRNPVYSTAYNPTTGTYEDGMLNDNIFQVLSYIKQLVDEDLIDFYGYTAGVTYGRLRKNTGTICGQASEVLPTQTFSTIRESQQGQVALMGYSSSAYVVLSNTVSAKEMVNNFVNVFMGDIDAHKMLRFGLPGVSYKEDGQNIILYDANRKNEDLLPRILVEMIDPEVLDPAERSSLYATEMTPIYYDQPYYVFYNEYDEYVAQYQEKALVETKSYFDKNPELFYEIPLLNKGFVTTFNVNGSIFSNVAVKIYENEMSVKDIIDAYIADSKYFNVLEQIEQINAQLGLQTKYKYDN